MHNRARSVVAMLCLAPLLAAGCSRNPVTGESEFIIISTQQEIAMGAEAAPQFEQEFGGRVPDTELQAYVRGVGMKIAAVAHRQDLPYEYTLVSSNVPNAFALPGGKIFVTAGLMARMGNERELAAVLGHETGHVNYRHNVKGMQGQIGASVLAKIAGAVLGGDKGKAAEAAAKIVGSMMNLRYSREYEYQADGIGIEYMTRAGYNPWGMVELLTTLKSLHDREPSALEEMFLTHPLTSKRIEEAQGAVQQKHAGQSSSAPDPNVDRFRRMRDRLVALTGDSG